MPGILPMKVIKVGTSTQTRIAQACDRCRSKKIRCDGVRPCCSQCASVGFECKTSDKLSRRAFPRGYTESLEERVRSLESEVRDLKDLLDEKDEKIDMLSRIHSQSSHPIQLPSPRRGSSTSFTSERPPAPPDKDEVFKVQQSPHLTSGIGSDSFFCGTSSGRNFIEAFRHKVQESGRQAVNIDTESLLSGRRHARAADSPLTPDPSVVYKAPPRLLSDQLINKYFQEWAPLFPVLHRPTFLALYGRYVEDADTVADKAEIAQLNLVFGIASLSIGTRSSADLDSFESQWRAAVDSVLTDNSMSTLQCLVLAQLHCVQQGDLTRLLTYKGLATTLSARLGLHQSQKRFALDALTCETRKKVFWTLYTVDSFSSVVLGLPKHIKDEDVHCEYPVDADDEYVTERGFQPTLPGESTKLSAALALFKAARILSNVLEEVFPAKTSYDLSLKKLADLSDELEGWSKALPPHLRLQFVQDKPSTGTISSRSPLLSLAYHFIRALIHRPAICSSTLGTRAHSSMLAMATSAKHVIQIVQLLDERDMGFSFCLNRDEVMVLSGIGLLFQRIRLDPSSKMLKDNQKMVCAVVDVLEKSHAPCASEFRKIACSLLPSQTAKSQTSPVQSVPKQNLPPLVRQNSDSAASMSSAGESTVQSLHASTKKQLRAIASRFSTSSAIKAPRMDPNEKRRNTVIGVGGPSGGLFSQSQPSLQPATRYDPASLSRSEPARSPVNMYSQPSRPASTATKAAPASAPPPLKRKSKPNLTNTTNLDYLSFGSDAEPPPPPPPQTSQAQRAPGQAQVKTERPTTDWDKLLSSLHNGPNNIFDACYGDQPVETLLDAPKLPPTYHHSNVSSSSVPVSASSPFSSGLNGGPDAWNSDLWALCHTDTNISAISNFSVVSGISDSMGSLSTESVQGGNDDYTALDWLSVSSGVGGTETYKGIVLPADAEGEAGASGWDAGHCS